MKTTFPRIGPEAPNHHQLQNGPREEISEKVPQLENTITGRDCGKRREYPSRRSLRLLVKTPLVISGFWNKRLPFRDAFKKANWNFSLLSSPRKEAQQWSGIKTPPNQLIDSTVIILSLRKRPFHEPAPKPQTATNFKWSLGRDIGEKTRLLAETVAKDDEISHYKKLTIAGEKPLVISGFWLPLPGRGLKIR
ncbi:hypothetical protein CEXT_773441 [Caerostris extrusa]|uniref:Uncharacterized protein n=1 Tax=Caerostris extrusa TaxID=172846 RepID=A0AAV4PF87_CAEEX|nr:hypothetical protein CEXT_773441 [Caerostris extrusa]